MIPVEVVGGVVLNTVGDILIVSQYGAGWSLPKGHVEVGEDFLTTAKREIYEESGVLDLKYIDDLGSYERMGGKNLDQLKHITIFLFQTKQMELKPVDPANPEARWVSKEEVVNFLTHEKDKEFWLKVKERVGQTIFLLEKVL